MRPTLPRSKAGSDLRRIAPNRAALAFAIVAAASSLTACVASEGPLLSDAQPVLGRQFTARIYRKFESGKAGELKTASFRWKDGIYVKEGADDSTLTRFVSQPLQGADSIVQAWNATGKLYSYWIGRKLMPGAYLLFPVDEKDADAATRTRLCIAAQPQGFCIVKTREQLMAMAGATAAAPVKSGEVAIIVEQGVDFGANAPVTR